MTKSFKSAVVIIPPQESSLYQVIQDIRQHHDRNFERWMPHINLLYPFVELEDFNEAVKRLRPIVQQLKPFTVSFCEQSFGYFKHGKSSATVWLKPVMPSAIDQRNSPVESPRRNNVVKSTSGEFEVVTHDDVPSEVDADAVHTMLKSTDWVDVSNEVAVLPTNGSKGTRKVKYVPANEMHATGSNNRPGSKSVGNTPSSNNHPSVMTLHQKLLAQYPYCLDVKNVVKGFQPHLTLGQFSPREHKPEELLNEWKDDWTDVNFEVDAIHLISREGEEDNRFKIVHTLKLGVAD